MRALLFILGVLCGLALCGGLPKAYDGVDHKHNFTNPTPFELYPNERAHMYSDPMIGAVLEGRRILSGQDPVDGRFERPCK